MRILFLGNSNERLALPQGTPLRPQLIREELTRDVAEIDLIAKDAWPTAALPRALEKWMGQLEPDVV